MASQLAWKAPDVWSGHAQVSIVRELHVYGAVVAVHARDASKHQHQVTL